MTKLSDVRASANSREEFAIGVYRLMQVHKPDVSLNNGIKTAEDFLDHLRKAASVDVDVQALVEASDSFD